MPLAGYHTSLGFPGRRQLLLHTIEQGKRRAPGWVPRQLRVLLIQTSPFIYKASRVVPHQLRVSPGGASSYCTTLSKPKVMPLVGRHTSLGFPGRCQLLLHTIEQAKSCAPGGVPHQLRVSPGGASSNCTPLSKPRVVPLAGCHTS